MRSNSSFWCGSLWLVLAVTAVAACRAAQAPPPEADKPSFEFALIGDNPYPEQNVPRFETLIQDVNQAAGLEWVLHLGDIQGGQPCTVELFQARFDLYQRFLAGFIFTPGDNDWFDCSSAEAGAGYEYERLAFLRQLFFPERIRCRHAMHCHEVEHRLGGARTKHRKAPVLVPYLGGKIVSTEQSRRPCQWLSRCGLASVGRPPVFPATPGG